MKIALLQPAKPKDSAPAASHWSLCRPLSLLFLASAIRKSGQHTCEIIDLERLFALNSSATLESILSTVKADAFGITATTFTRHDAIATAKILRKYNPSVPIIVGGVHFMYCASDALSSVPEIDIVVRGEGEQATVELLNALSKDGDLSSILGISYRTSEGDVSHNQDSNLFEDLDSCEIHDFQSPADYPEYLFGSNEPIKAVSIMTSRGCPYHCLFCAKAGMKYRHRSSDSVISEIKYFQTHYGIYAFNLLDLTFTASPKRSIELCNAIIKEELDIQWWCETRANIPLDLIPLMAEAGCRHLVIGVETGSPRILNRIQKGVDLGQVERVIAESVKSGISPTCYFMLSHPGETYKDAQETLTFIRYLINKYEVCCALQPCMVLPGTKIEEIARKNGSLPHNFSWSAPYFEKSNLELGQVSNIPLFWDSLSFNELKMLLEEFREITESEVEFKKIPQKYTKFSWSRIKTILKKRTLNEIANIALHDARVFIKTISAHRKMNRR
jgi:radical SAM superfamily enzyme YgiQ (UPF0313 family)